MKSMEKISTATNSEWSLGKPPETRRYGDNTSSENVTVLLDNGEVSTDFTLNGKWTIYCEKNPTMPHVVGWMEPLNSEKG